MYRLLLPLLFISGCASFDRPAEESTCKALVYAYPQIRDTGTSAQYANLFTDDARFTVEKLNIELNGQTQIVERYDKARNTTNTVHMMTSSRFYRSNDQLKAESHFILLLKDKAQPATTKIINGRYLDTFSYDSDRCLFSLRDVVIDRMDIL
ncbi:hypothetical protein CWB99_00865 [Pseudoalteromonas rubra]|uniref:SnoaL-like domain-containing protein n=1 Tax=Pseudoalteromonas rubra TaxID=43658 RepID=A0A5S3WVV6_9GAMM|nr:nuclear transport factor 2 family protein [Pseudoalteromonas rubra]TMP31684.1 hypothetical protein CWC00_13770 [Pseudoalteromonas rubra]TMP33234.1 hypothetical protein CWB99_00865 [Pseudoalteromonas rubra]